MSSLRDPHVSKAIWDGKLPLKISLVTAESADNRHEPLFVQVPRCSYLPLLTDHVVLPALKGFYGLADVTDDAVWYSYQDEPLKWHYPIGLLHDLLQEVSLPWSISVHVRDYPTAKLLRGSAQDMFMSMIKEADFVRHGSTKKVMNLSKKDHSLLWQSLGSAAFEDYWRVNDTLIDDHARFVPMRVYLTDSPPNPPILLQDRIAPDTYETLGAALAFLLPDLFPEYSPQADVLIHGLAVPLDTPLAWASQNLSHADNFLHVVVARKKDKKNAPDL